MKACALQAYCLEKSNTLCCTTANPSQVPDRGTNKQQVTHAALHMLCCQVPQLLGVGAWWRLLGLQANDWLAGI
jgi:hypothetical protein